MTRRRLALLVLPAVVLAGCSQSDSLESTEPEPATTAVPSTVADTTTTPPTTTAPTTTIPPTTAPEASTSVAPTTAAAAPVATTVPAADVLPGPAPAPPTRAWVTGDSALLEVDSSTGASVRTVVELFNGDGVFRGGLRLAPDASSLWFSEGYEDGWYGCETSVGSFGRVDLTTGAIEIVGTGVTPEPSPDGTRVAHVASGLCLPDPEAPELWVLTPYDRAVVRDLATGGELVFVTDPAPTGYDSPSQVDWAGFASDGSLLVRTADHRLHRVDLAGSGTLQDHPVIIEDLLGFPVGVIGEVLVTVDDGTEGSVDVYAVDLTTGATAKLAGSDGYLTVGLSADGAIVVSGIAEVTVEPDAPVTVLVAPTGFTYYDIDW